jgi:predicted 3-demethylubiquinone-9 3-methyltransferase (glyoxalase superfamily)
MSKITTCLWFNGNAEEAASFYVSLLPDSRILSVAPSPADNPSTPAGAVLTVDFTIAGQPMRGLNGGPEFQFNEAISLVIDCEVARSMRVAEGPLRSLVADRPAPAR